MNNQSNKCDNIDDVNATLTLTVILHISRTSAGCIKGNKQLMRRNVEMILHNVDVAIITRAMRIIGTCVGGQRHTRLTTRQHNLNCNIIQCLMTLPFYPQSPLQSVSSSTDYACGGKVGGA